MPSKLPSPFALGAVVLWLGITVMWWALAFAPLPVPEKWLADARSVCFGTLSNGLPDTYGWVALFMGPLSILVFLVAVWGRELVLDAGWLAARGGGVALLVALALVPVVGLGWVSARVARGHEIDALATSTPRESALPEGYPRTNRPAPPIELVDQAGDRLSLGSFGGRTVVVTFAYAHCTTVCPVVVETVRSATVSLGSEAPAVLVVTLDPWRDRPSTLGTLARSWKLDTVEDAHLLSGEIDEVLATLEAWNMPISRDESTGEIAHPGLIYLVDGGGEIAYSFNNPPRTWVIDAARRIERERS